MDIMRLFLFEDCERNCKGCCNKDWNIKNLPYAQDFEKYDVILLTGGEPMLKPWVVTDVVRHLREHCCTNQLIYMYTAKVTDMMIYHILELIDGITVTLHDKSDIKSFSSFNEKLLKDRHYYLTKSLRLNIFNEVGRLPCKDLSLWKIKDKIKWIKKAPLPDNETFMRWI
jgi:hypothetical protein